MEAARITEVTGDPRHPFTQGVICGKVRDYAERVHSPLRVLTPASPRRAQGRGALRADRLGRGGRRDRAPLARVIAAATARRRSCRSPTRARLGQVQYCAGPPALPRARRQPARPHHLRQHRLRGLAGHAGHGHRQRLRADGGRRPDRAVGHQRRLHPHQRDDARQAGARQRGALVVCDRSLPHADRAAGRRAPDGAAGDRRRPSPWRVMHVLDRRGARRPGVHRGAPRSASTALAEHVQAVRRPSGWPPIAGLAAETIVAFARRYGATRARVHPRRHRALPPRQRRHDVPDHRVPARADRRLRASRTAARCCRPAAAFGFDFAVIERPDLMPEPAPRIDQHDPPRARAHRSGPGAAGQGALRVQLEPGRRSAPTRTLVLQGLAREDLFTVVHEQVTSPTPPTTPISCSRPPRRWSTPTCYSSYGHFYVQLARPVIAAGG